MTDTQKKRYWELVERLRNEEEAVAIAMLMDFFNEQGKVFVRALRESGTLQSGLLALDRFQPKLKEVFTEFVVSTYTTFSTLEFARLSGQPISVITTGQEGLRRIERWNNAARIYAEEHAGQLVTRVTQVTKDLVRGITLEILDSGEGIPETVKIIEERWGDISRMRAERIARTEVVSAGNAGSMGGAQDFEDETGVVLVKVWISDADDKVRDSHHPDKMAHQRPRINEPFIVGDEEAMYAGDPRLSAASRVNCFHPDTLVIPNGVKKVFRHWYTGKLINIKTARGMELSVTPNHPILTCKGWKGAGEIVEGDNLITDLFDIKRGGFHSGFDIDNVPTRISEVFDLTTLSGTVGRVPPHIVNFHGDIPERDIDVVSMNSRFKSWGKPSIREFIKNILSINPLSTFGAFTPFNTFNNIFIRAFTTPNSVVGFLSEMFPSLSVGMLHPKVHRLGTVSGVDPVVDKYPSRGSTCNTHFVKDLFSRKPVEVKLTDFSAEMIESVVLSETPISLDVVNDAVVFVGELFHDDYVYNMETEKNWYGVVNDASTKEFQVRGVFAHNCRCASSHIPLDSEPIKMLVPNLEPKERRRIAKRAYKALREKGVSSDDILEMLGEKACVSPLTIKSDVFSKRR